MKEIRSLSFFVFFLLIFYSGYSQQTAFFSDVSKDVQMARELFHQQKYNAAFRQFEKVQKQVDPKSELFSEAVYFKAVSAMKAGHSSGYRMLEKFIDDYPDSPYMNLAKVNLGDYQFERKHFAAVLRTYADVNRSSLSEDD